MKKILGLFALTGVFGVILFAQGCALFSDKYAIEHKKQNDNNWLEKKHGYRDVANYEAEEFDERYQKH